MDRGSKIAVWAVAGVVAAAVLVFLPTPRSSLTSFQQGQMPWCDSTPARLLLKQSIERSPVAQQAGLKIDFIGSVEDYSGQPTPGSTAADPSQELRFCKANVYTSAGQGDIHFTLKWIDTAKTQIWLQVTVSTI